MWISKLNYQKLHDQLVAASQRAVLAEASLSLQRTAHRNVLKDSVRRIRVAESRTERAETALELERHENRLAERHWANQLLRAKQAFPLQPEKEAKPAPRANPVGTLIDPGELEALETEALRLGIDPARAREILYNEHGITN